MSTQPIERPSKDDDIYSNEPTPPRYVQQGGIAAWLVLGVLLFTAAIVGSKHAGPSIFIALAGFVIGTVVFFRWSKVATSWYSTYRWYRSTVKRKITTEEMSNYELALKPQVKPEEVVLKMANGHKLKFNGEPPADLLAAKYIAYQAAWVNGVFKFKNVQPYD